MGGSDPRKIFSDTLLKLGEVYETLLAVSCDSASGSGMSDFIGRFPNRYVEIGISEQNAIGVCAGLAQTGYIPVVSAIAPFISMRCFEQVRNDIGYSNMNVKIIGSSSGLSHSTLGSTHQAVEDIALMRSIPNMVVLNPGDAFEVEMALHEAVAWQGPVYIRMPRHKTEDLLEPEKRSFQIGRGERLSSGRDVALLVSGTLAGEAKVAANILEDLGLSTGVYNFPTVKPLDDKLVAQAVTGCRMAFTIEEHSVVGGFGGAVMEAAAPLRTHAPIYALGIPQGATDNGPYKELLASYSLTGETLAKKIYELY